MHCSLLSKLPSAPAGKIGWPWTEESPPAPETKANGTSTDGTVDIIRKYEPW